MGITSCVVLGGLMAYLFWQEQGPVVTAIEPAAKPKVEPVKPAELAAAAPAAVKPADLLALETSAAGPDEDTGSGSVFQELTLTQQLDDYFINGIALDNVQLGQAMSILRQKLQETDSDQALPLQRLAVSTPAAALGRRVTLFSESMPYLQAVRNIATQAACEVEVTENRITLRLLPGPYPQVAARRGAKEILAGRFTEDGRPLAEDETALERLIASAKAMGLKTDAQGELTLTPAQLAALQGLNWYELQMAQYPLPAYAVYVLPRNYLSPFQRVDPQSVFGLLVALHQQGFVPYSRVPDNLDPATGHLLLVVMRQGASVALAILDVPPRVAEQTVAEVPQRHDDSVAYEVRSALIAVQTGPDISYSSVEMVLRARVDAAGLAAVMDAEGVNLNASVQSAESTGTTAPATAPVSE